MAADNQSITKSLDTLREAVGVMPSPFAKVPSATIDIEDSVSDDISFRNGFPDNYAKPIIDPATGEVDPTAKVITRRQLNTLGNIGSQTQFFEQCGGYYTFDQAVSNAIGGYPKGAILKFYDADTNALRTVKSLKDDNADNFLEDRSFIGSLVYDYEEGQHISWVYVDDNPEVGVFVDYSDYIDLSDTLFVETGIPDLYEVPYDAYLQMWAVGYIGCDSLARSDAQSVEMIQGYRQAGEDYEKLSQTINGMYFTYTRGTSYIDVYNVKNEGYVSSVIGGFFPVEWLNNTPGIIGEDAINHYTKFCTLSPFSCGIWLSRGDKIRVRNEVYDILHSAAAEKYKVIANKLFHDDVLRRKYLYRFANLYRRGVCP